MPNNLIFIGPMGAGKSTIGRQLAKLLNWPFYDLDESIEAKAGVSIAWIFDQEGEKGFRQRETLALRTFVEQPHNSVLATGGGVIKSAQNRYLLHRHGYIIYLYSSLEQQLNRVVEDRRRPLLNTPDPAARLALLTQQRQHHYQALAQESFCTDGYEALAVAKLMYERLRLSKHVTG